MTIKTGLKRKLPITTEQATKITIYNAFINIHKLYNIC